MPHKFIKDLTAVDTVDQVFQVAAKQKRTTKTGSTYFHLELRDKTGKVTAKIWDDKMDGIDEVTDNSFAFVYGRVELYKGDLQINISAIKPAADSEVAQENFVAFSSNDIEALYEELKELLSKIEDEYLLELVEQFLNDKEFVLKFKKSPAAVEIHHAFAGGLLEHTVNLLRLATRVAECYVTKGALKEPLLNTDLLLAGCFLHDIGKIKEYEIKVMPQITDEGRLLGHTILGISMLEEKIRNIPNFPPMYKSLLEHLIGSHHGQHEYGAPVLPMLPEAQIVHHLDNMDARMGEYQILLQNSLNNSWTERSKSLGRAYYKAPPLESKE